MGEYSSNIIVKNCPFLGRIHFIWDTRGIICMSFVYLYWIYGNYSMFGIILLPGYEEGHISAGFIAVFSFCSFMTLCSLFRASTLNPGRVPLIKDVPKLEEMNYTYCKVCMRQRPLKAHHCRRCKQCVMRLDHHCPWINNCVGENNHWAFMQLLVYAFLMSFLASILCLLHWYVYPKCTTCDKTTFIVRHQRNLMYLSTFLSFLMAISMSTMFIGQHINLIMDRTTLDSIRDPFMQELVGKKFRPWREVYDDFCGPGPKICWAFPCRKRRVKPVYLYTTDMV